MENLRQLHIIRGIAALYVAIGHAKVILWSGGSAYLDQFPRETWNILDYLFFALDMLSSSAREFVIVFFVLSGFFIAYSFEKNQWKVKDFLVNRTVRLVPPYLFSVLLSIMVFFCIYQFAEVLFQQDFGRAINVRMIKSFQELNAETLARSLFLLPNNDYIAGNFSYWSLIQEWIFYLIIPFVIMRKNIALIVSAALFFIGHLLLDSYTAPILRFLFEFAIYFFLGVRFYPYITSGKWRTLLPSRMVSYGLVLGLFFTTIALGALELYPFSAVVAAIATMVCIMVLLRYPLQNALVFRMGTFLGDISYTLYIIHLPFFYSVYAILFVTTGEHVFYNRLYWLAIPPLILLAYGGFVLVESKTLTWIKRLKTKRVN